MKTGIDVCHPELARRYLLVEADFAATSRPWTLRRTRTLATTAEQAALYAQGRLLTADVNRLRRIANLWDIGVAENAHTVTECDGVKRKSKHQGAVIDGVLLSLAIDVVPTQDPDGPGPLKAVVTYADRHLFEVFGGLCARHGLVWGGSWKRPDMPHAELPEALV